MAPPGELIVIELELELGAKPIRGAIRSGDGSSQPFDGWMQLTAALEDARAGEPSPGRRSTRDKEEA